MRSKLGIFCIIIGTVLIISALSLFALNNAENNKAGESAGSVLVELENTVEKNTEVSDTENVPDPYDPVMNEIEIDGDMYIGVLTLPKLGLKLPVMSDWSMEKLTVSPCRYYGSVKTNDLIIMAHNYRYHFKNIGELEPGDDVIFTDVDGIVWRYTVAAMEILPENANQDLINAGWDLTLFTCTYDGNDRIVIRCTRNY